MSTPAPRTPARVWRVARAYLRLLVHGGTIAGLCLGLLYALGGEGVWCKEADGPLKTVRELSWLMFFFPLLHWRRQAGRSALQAALPIGRVRHELVRVGCGTAWAAATLAGATALRAWQVVETSAGDPRSLDDGYPAWYPFALLAAGITLYLLGSAVLLRFERPVRGFVLVSALSVVTLGLWPAVFELEVLPSGTWRYLLIAYREPEELARLSTPEWLGSAVLGLGLACTAVYAAVRKDPAGIPTRVGAVARVEEALRRRLGRGLTRGSARRPLRTKGLRRPPSTVAVARRHFALLSRRMTWPMVVAVFFACEAAAIEMKVGTTFPRLGSFGGSHATFAFYWPLLVWIDERGQLWEFDEALPVGPAKKRILHAVAGAAWLLLGLLILLTGHLVGAAAAGTLTSLADLPVWFWLGLPCSAVTLYLFGTLLVLQFQRLDLAVFLVFIVWLLLRLSPLDYHPLAPVRAIAPFLAVGKQQVGYGTAWSSTTSALWLTLHATAAAWVLARSARTDRERPFPSRTS